MIYWWTPVKASPVFVRVPSTQNVTEGSTATFNCTGYSQSYYWLINGRLPGHSSNDNRGLKINDRAIDGGSHLNEHLLQLPALQINNGLSIQCFLYTLGIISSDVAYLNIQGVLTTVTNVSLSRVNSSTISISYVAPPTLVGIPISNYSIFINITNEIYWSEDENFQITLYNACFNYTLEICAWNAVGQGAPYYQSVLIHEVPVASKIPNNSTITFTNSGNPIVAITTQITNISCLGKNPHNMTIIIVPLAGPMNQLSSCTLEPHGGGSSCDEVSLIPSDNTWSITINVSDHIQPFHHYKAHVIYGNEAGNTENDSYIIPFNTFHTQSVIVENTLYLCVTCFFASGSNTPGCHGVFTTPLGDVAMTINVPRSSVGPNTDSGRSCSNDALPLPSGNYTLSVYDKDSNGNIIYTSSAVVISNIIIHERDIEIAVTTTTTAITTTTNISSSSDSIITSSHLATLTTGSVPAVSTEANELLILNELSLSLIILSIFGGILILTVVVVVILISCLVRVKKKNRRLKLAQTFAHQRQRHAETLLMAFNLNTTTSGGQHVGSNDTPMMVVSVTSPLPSNEPLYDNANEIQSVMTNRQAPLHLKDCPAYSTRHDFLH
jgi:hypothetical protein